MYDKYIEHDDNEFVVNGEEVQVSYWLKSQGIELTTIYKNEYRKMYYIDEFDDFYDEYELLSYLNECFAEYLKTL